MVHPETLGVAHQDRLGTDEAAELFFLTSQIGTEASVGTRFVQKPPIAQMMRVT
jgi:hypothetical protein